MQNDVAGTLTFGLVGHGGSGKTSLGDAILYRAGAVDRLGRVADGTSALDVDPDELHRGITLGVKPYPLAWRSRSLVLIDTPGYLDFEGEVRNAARVCDALVIVVDAAAGIQYGVERAVAIAEAEGVAQIFAVNKLEREHTSFERTLEEIRSQFGPRAVAMSVPVGAAADLKGVRGVLDGLGRGPGGAPLPPGEVDEGVRSALVEAAIEGDDDLLARYLDGQELSAEEVRAALAAQVRRRGLHPVLAVSAHGGVGIDALLDAIVDAVGEPREFGVQAKGGPASVRVDPAGESALYVFKTVADPYVGKLSLFRVLSGVVRADLHLRNAARGVDERIGQVYRLRGRVQEPVGELRAGDVGGVAKLQGTHTGDTLTQALWRLEPPVLPPPVYRMAVRAASKQDEDHLAPALARLVEEDPTLRVERDASGQILVGGLGEMHLEVVAERLKRKFGVTVSLALPRVQYRETIRGQVKAEGKHKRQTGGRGQYGHVWLEVRPQTEEPFRFVDKIFGGSVPQSYRPAVEKGVVEAMAEGIVAHYPVTGVEVILYDGSFHPVDSSEMAFKIAGSLAFKKAAAAANPVILEPMLELVVECPSLYTGEVISDLNKKRGRILGIEPTGGGERIRAIVPEAEMLRYAIDLRSLTQGRGSFTTRPSGHEEAPPAVAQQIIEEANRLHQAAGD